MLKLFRLVEDYSALMPNILVQVRQNHSRFLLQYKSNQPETRLCARFKNQTFPMKWTGLKYISMKLIYLISKNKFNFNAFLEYYFRTISVINLIKNN